MSASSTVDTLVPTMSSPSLAQEENTADAQVRKRYLEGLEAHQVENLLKHERLYPGFIEITRRARALEKAAPHLVTNPNGSGWVGSSDPRWLELYGDARRVIGQR